MLAALRSALRHAFSIEPEPLSADDGRFLDEVAARVAKRRLSVPAVLALEALRYTPGLYLPFFATEPIVGPIVGMAKLGLVRSGEEYARLVRIFERREHVAALERKIEALSAEAAALPAELGGAP